MDSICLLSQVKKLSFAKWDFQEDGSVEQMRRFSGLRSLEVHRAVFGLVGLRTSWALCCLGMGGGANESHLTLETGTKTVGVMVVLAW